jgi:hypothetical protein
VKKSCFYTGQLPDMPVAQLFLRWLQAPPASKVQLRRKSCISKSLPCFLLVTFHFTAHVTKRFSSSKPIKCPTFQCSKRQFSDQGWHWNIERLGDCVVGSLNLNG